MIRTGCLKKMLLGGTISLHSSGFPKVIRSTLNPQTQYPQSSPQAAFSAAIRRQLASYSITNEDQLTSVFGRVGEREGRRLVQRNHMRRGGWWRGWSRICRWKGSVTLLCVRIPGFSGYPDGIRGMVFIRKQKNQEMNKLFSLNRLQLSLVLQLNQWEAPSSLPQRFNLCLKKIRFFDGQEVALTWWKKATEQRTAAMRAKNPNPIIREIPAMIRSIAVCTLIHIILLKILRYDKISCLVITRRRRSF